ncbi:MAG TPA: hypothetical protein VK428_10095, partial [Acidimicrobiales bacterium]|nr:hypothetical protein [Acidimicrobiales bacterium]
LRSTLFVSASGPALPVKETAGDSTGTTTATFNDWGEPVRVTAPAGAVSGDALSALLGGTSNPAGDRAARSNLTNALTEVKAIYQNSQSYSPGQVPLTPAGLSSQAPEFAWTTQACAAASPANCVSVQVVDAAQPGDGQGIILAVYSPGSQNCRYGLDLESPASSFTDTASDIALVSPGRSPAGVSTPGVFYAEEPTGAVSGGPSTYCSGACAATQSTFSWGPSFSNAGTGA